MSDSATNTGSDDVLSSIRRLVSDTQLYHLSEAPEDAPASAEGADQNGSKRQDGKLLLTPSLRVGDSSEPAERDDSGDNTADRTEPLLLTDPMAPWQDPDATLYATSAGASASEGADSDEGAEAGFVHLEDDDADMSVSGESSNVVPLVLKREHMADTSDLHQEFIFGTVRDKEALPPEIAPDESADSPLQARLGALEAALETSDEAFEPEEADDGDYAGTSTAELSWAEDDLELPSEPQPEPRAEAEPETPPVLSEEGPQEADEIKNLLQDPDPVAALDEAALEDLVTEIVRRELQGVLGERITRNVRKMVRREIQRALALKEFE